MQMNRSEHLAWCKQRALEYVDKGDLVNAVTSMLSDLGKHPETVTTNPFLPACGMIYAGKRDAPSVRRWIKGFN